MVQVANLSLPMLESGRRAFSQKAAETAEKQSASQPLSLQIFCGPNMPDRVAIVKEALPKADMNVSMVALHKAAKSMSGRDGSLLC